LLIRVSNHGKIQIGLKEAERKQSATVPLS